MDYSGALRAYEEIYSGQKEAYSQRPFFLLKRIKKCFQNGTAVDFGAGEGRNSVFLARQGFSVEAVDFSDAALKKLENKAKKKSLAIRVKKTDLSRLNLAGRFDVGICTFVLHNLSVSTAKKLIRKMRNYTKIGGINVLACFTKRGHFFRKNPRTKNFFPNQTELKKIYADWKIHEITIKKTRVRPTDAEGKALFSDFVAILAQKN